MEMRHGRGVLQERHRMSIMYWPVLPLAAVGPILLSRYLRHTRRRRCLERLEDALSFDVPRPWHREARQALRSADDWVFTESLNFGRNRTSPEARQLVPLTGEVTKTPKSS